LLPPPSAHAATAAKSPLVDIATATPNWSFAPTSSAVSLASSVQVAPPSFVRKMYAAPGLVVE